MRLVATERSHMLRTHVGERGTPPESKGKDLCVEYSFRFWPWPFWA